MRRIVYGYGSLLFAAVLLAGCGGSQMQGAPMVPGSTQTLSVKASSARSWMQPQTRGSKSILIYTENETNGDVDVYDYANGKQVGTLSGVIAGSGCVDAAGDVYLVKASGSVLEYAHGGTQPINTYSPGGDLVGCSVDAHGDLGVTGSTPGTVTLYANGNPKVGLTYSNALCESQSSMGYDDKGNLIGLGSYESIQACAILVGGEGESILSTHGITVNAANGTMWDGKYIAVGDQEAGAGKQSTGLYETSLSGAILTSHGEVILTDTCYRGYTDVRNPFIVGKKNTPINGRQGNVVVGSNLLCFSGSGGGIEFWHYPKGGNPFKMYPITDPMTVIAVSIGT